MLVPEVLVVKEKTGSMGLNGVWLCPKDSVTQYAAFFFFPPHSNSTDHHEILALKEGE